MSDPAGVILDIDLSEEWTIEARDAADDILETIVLTAGDTPGTGNGLATPWAFDRGSQDIYSIALRFTGSGSLIGLAFDNFSPSVTGQTIVPEPTAFVLAGLGGLGLFWHRRRQLKRSCYSTRISPASPNA